MQIDQRLRDEQSGKKVYEDTEYDAYDSETDEEDSSSQVQVNSDLEEEWEDVEVDDM